jgi:hypothetical protein
MAGHSNIDFIAGDIGITAGIPGQGNVLTRVNGKLAEPQQRTAQNQTENKLSKLS